MLLATSSLIDFPLTTETTVALMRILHATYCFQHLVVLSRQASPTAVGCCKHSTATCRMCIPVVRARPRCFSRACRPFQQLLSTYGAAQSASENLEAILERMKEDGLEPDLKTYNHILDL